MKTPSARCAQSGLPTFLFLVTLLQGSGCASKSPLARIPERAREGGSVEVILDSNLRSIQQGRIHRTKFWVDVTNNTDGVLDFSYSRVELNVSPVGDPLTIRLSRSWSYDFSKLPDGAGKPVLTPGKKFTIPVVPEVQEHHLPASLGAGESVTVSEFPLESLIPGEYEVRATVNDYRPSPPYRLMVED